MNGRYILAVDQSTQGTKGMIFDASGKLLARADAPHAQLVDANGWVEHDPEEILRNTLAVCRAAAEKAGIAKGEIAALGVSNQRETCLAWDNITGKPLHNAIVWQCGRAKEICAELADNAEVFKSKTGLTLSPYFSAPKLTWLLHNVPAVAEAAQNGPLCCGTMDAWLVYSLTENHAFKTDYSNASRTGLFNIHTLQWDEDLCALYEVPQVALPKVCMSDAQFGTTTLGGWLDAPIPLCGVLGDSHAALLGQGCFAPGMVKATYGTGSSVMMQTGAVCTPSESLVTSLAWGLDGKVEYVLEGNLNYTGAVMTWLKNDVGLIATDAESEELACRANPADRAYFIPAFTGLGAPYWDSEATGMLTGITRTTGKAEIVKAALDCIAYQISDLLRLMASDSGLELAELRVDGGPTANRYLMQFQSDMAGVPVSVPAISELSGYGAALAAGTACGLYAKADLGGIGRTAYTPTMPAEERTRRIDGWQNAVRQVLHHS